MTFLLWLRCHSSWTSFVYYSDLAFSVAFPCKYLSAYIFSRRVGIICYIPPLIHVNSCCSIRSISTLFIVMVSTNFNPDADKFWIERIYKVRVFSSFLEDYWFLLERYFYKFELVRVFLILWSSCVGWLVCLPRPRLRLIFRWVPGWIGEGRNLPTQGHYFIPWFSIIIIHAVS